MRTKEEIEQKIAELYQLAQEGKRDMVRVIIETDTLAWVSRLMHTLWSQ